MRIAFLCAVLILLAGCAAPAANRADDAARAVRALPGPVSYDVSSWGRLLLHWQVNPDGSGEIWRGSGLGKGPGEVRKFRLRMDAAGMAAFAVTIEPLRVATKNGTPCQRTITDQPYGSVRWDYPRAKQTWSFDAGCRSPAADAAADQLAEAHRVVEGMATIDEEPYMIDRGST